MNELLPLIRAEGKDPARLAARIRGRRRDLASVEEGAQKIITRVRSEGDAALRQLTLELDHAEIGGRIRLDRE
jgi:histidinol dehydrogenase